jgi:hypothetical protein
MRKPCSKSGCRLIHAVFASAALVFLAGCGPSPEAAVKKLYRPSPDKDVTSAPKAPKYNFSSFANTIWKTKVEVAIAGTKRYTGAPEVSLLAPERFDPTHPRYSPGSDMRIVAVLPPGTHLRIARLMQDQGAWGGVQVEAVLLDGTNSQKSVLLDPLLLSGNRWARGPDSNTNWGINPDMLQSP